MSKQDEPNSNLDGAVGKTSAERFLVFSLCNEDYAVPLLKVKEVIAITEMTAVPYTPSHFNGIMNLRGKIISVIALRFKFRMSKAEIKPESAIIILDLHPLSFGVIVDAVDSVLAVSAAEIQPAPDVESQVKSDYLTGVTRKQDKLVLLLDIERTLNVDDLKSIKTATMAHSA